MEIVLIVWSPIAGLATFRGKLIIVIHKRKSLLLKGANHTVDGFKM